MPPQDPQALADALMQLAGDPDRAMRLSRAGRARVVERFDSHRGADMLIREIWHKATA